MDVLERLEVANRYFAIRDGRGLRRVLSESLPQAADIDAVAELVDLALKGRDDLPDLPEQSAKFADAIRSVRRRWPDGVAAPAAKPADGRRTVDRNFDFLGDRLDVADWSIAQALAVLQRRQLKPTRRAAVIGTMRDDGLYALEWIAHYQALGFEVLVIYSNDNADGSEVLLRQLAEHGVIIFVESDMGPGVRPEVKAFEHATCFVPEVSECEWALFVDSDELLTLAPEYENSIRRYLDAVPPPRKGAPRLSSVLFQWLWFNSGMVYGRTQGTLLERFRYASPHWLTKPLVRLSDLMSMRLQHVPELAHDAVMADSEFGDVNVDELWLPRDPNYGGGRINHYWPKSFQEFLLKKARGDSLQGVDNEYSRSFELFFEWNAPETPETFTPPDEALVAEVARRREALRALSGVVEAEAAIEARFAKMMRFYESSADVGSIYEHLLNTTTGHSLPEH